jgi:FkbM family methyltransferase
MPSLASSADLRSAIEHWLDSHVAPLAAGERHGFSTWRGMFGGPLYVYGSGGLGRKLVAGLAAEGVEIDGFCDSNPAVWGREILGLPVVSPEAAVARAGKAGGFIVSTWSLGKESSNADMRRNLERLGAQHLTFFTTPFWQYPARFLPHYRIDLPSKLLASRAEIIAAAETLADEESRNQFFVQLRMLATTTFDEVSYATPGDTYFPADLVKASMLRRFVDCGAFDGDTFKTLLKYAGDSLERYWGFEPDPANLERLRATIAATAIGQSGRAESLPYAIADQNGPLSFDATGDVGARVVEAGGIEVQCRRLDDVLASEQPTFIKMDIEGSELDAIAGARQILAAYRPACAVCVYHFQWHLWEVPLRLSAALAGHSVHLRSHAATYDVVCYAVPTDHPMRRCP